MTNLLDLTSRLKQAEPSYEDASELIDQILSLSDNQMMVITNVNGELRCQIMNAHWFKV